MNDRRLLHQMGFAEQIVIWAVRNWLNGGDHWRKVEAEFTDVFGMARGTTACQALDSLLWILNTSARRSVCLGRLCCDRVWPDEIRLISVLRQCQGAADAQAAAQLADLLPPTAARVAADYAVAAAEVLQSAGYRLAETSRVEAPPRPVHLHPTSMAVH